MVLAIEENSETDEDGSTDYQRTVVGAWTWPPEPGFGIVTQVEKAKGFKLLSPEIPCSDNRPKGAFSL